MVMSAATFTSRILGLVREQTIAYLFGATHLVDIFNVAYRIPNLLRDLLAEGAFSSAFVPTFTQALRQSKEEAKELFRSCFWFLLLLTGTVTILFYVAAPSFVGLFAPEYLRDPEKLYLTSLLLKIMAPFLALTTIAALAMGVLNTYKYFFIPALAPASFNVMSVLVVWLLAQKFGIYSLGWGVLLGGFCQFAFQLPLLKKEGIDFRFPKTFLSAGLLSILRKLLPGLVGYSSSQINVLINTILATSAGVGAVSWLSYAFRLFSFPLGILSVSISNSTLVHFSELWKSHEHEKAKQLLTKSYYYSLFLVMVPWVVMLVFPDWIVAVVFQRGKFLFTDTTSTSLALFWYSMGLPAYGLYKMFVPLFYSLEKSYVPMYTSLVTLSVNLLYSFWFTKIYGHQVLAQATTISMTLNTLLLGYMLKKYLSLPWNFFWPKPVILLGLQSSFLLVAAWSLKSFFEFHHEMFLTKVFLLGFISILIFLLQDFCAFFMGGELLTKRLWLRLKK
jgi:putative peptidoglycan lipid II flippase